MSNPTNSQKNDRSLLGGVGFLPEFSANCDQIQSGLPQHKVEISSFYLDKYEVTNRLFQQFIEQANYRTSADRKEQIYSATIQGILKYSNTWLNPEGKESVFASSRGGHPVVNVSWDDAVAYCRWAGKRLPTEAEWEYADRAGATTRYRWGNLISFANFKNIEDFKRAVAEEAEKLKSQKPSKLSLGTAQIGEGEANNWGLYDMGGNVEEWTGDWYDKEYYSKSPLRNPKGPTSGEYRTVRGAFSGGGLYVDSDAFAWRGHRRPWDWSPAVGFRCAQDVPK